jgi:hypothetical protein
MKKVILVVLMSLFTLSAASAAPTRERIKSATERMEKFWANEGERSGLAESTSSWDNFWTNANPVNFFKNQQDAYNARKDKAVAK